MTLRRTLGVFALFGLALLRSRTPLDLQSDARAELRIATTDPTLEPYLRTALDGVRPELRSFVAGRIAQRLRELRDARLSYSTDELRRRVIDFEVWKCARYLSAGVFPKRYFGYLDGRGDTQIAERTLKETVTRARPIAEAFQQKRGSRIRAADLEIVVTFLAEGGATLLSDDRHASRDVPAISGIGLDDIANGFAARPELVHAFDASFGTGLGDFIGRAPPRKLTFVEAVLATEVMYLYEKELLASKLARSATPGLPLDEQTLDEQFIATSLQYNSGIAFSPERIAMIRAFASADYIYQLSLSMRATRPRLPLAAPAETTRQLLSLGDYPTQRTSWSAVYHVLQRWGAFAALRQFTDTFDADGMYRPSSSN